MRDNELVLKSTMTLLLNTFSCYSGSDQDLTMSRFAIFVFVCVCLNNVSSFSGNRRVRQAEETTVTEPLIEEKTTETISEATTGSLNEETTGISIDDTTKTLIDKVTVKPINNPSEIDPDLSEEVPEDYIDDQTDEIDEEATDIPSKTLLKSIFEVSKVCPKGQYLTKKRQCRRKLE